MPNVVFSLTRLTIPVHNTMGLVHTRLIRACHKQLIAERALPVLKSADPTVNQSSHSPCSNALAVGGGSNVNVNRSSR